MSQSTYIAGALVLGFILFLAARGRLKNYGQALFGASPAASSTSSKSGGGGILGQATDAIGSAGKVIGGLGALGIGL